MALFVNDKFTVLPNLAVVHRGEYELIKKRFFAGREVTAYEMRGNELYALLTNMHDESTAEWHELKYYKTFRQGVDILGSIVYIDCTAYVTEFWKNNDTRRKAYVEVVKVEKA